MNRASQNILAIMLLALFPLRAGALNSLPPNDPIISIDSTVFTADVIVRGSLVQRKLVNAYPLWRSGGLFAATFPSTRSVYVCTLKVTEVLKGPPELANAKTLTLACESKPGSTDDALFCLVSTARYFAVKTATTQQSGSFANETWVLDQGRGDNCIISLDAANRVFDSAGQAIKGTDAILNVVRREVAHPPVEQFGTLYLEFSGSSEYFHEPFAPSQGLKILVDRRTENRARQWIKSKDPGDRWNAVNVLKQFRSPENIALLHGLLNDQTSWYFLGDRSFSGWANAASGKWHGEAYTIRRAAWDALNNWGTSPPIVPVEVPKYAPTYIRTWLPGASTLLILGISLAMVLLVWLKRGRLLTGLHVLSFCLFVLTGALSLWSQWRIGEVILASPPDSDRNEIALLDGRLRWLRIEHWTDPVPASINVVPRTDEADSDWQPEPTHGWLYQLPLNGTSPPPPASHRHMAKLEFAYDCDDMDIDGFGTCSYRAVTVPLWFLVGVFGILPVTRLFRIGRKRRLFRQNRCVSCGYDLRASTDRCPECGLKISVPDAARAFLSKQP